MISCVMSIYGFYSTNLVLRRQETSATMFLVLIINSLYAVTDAGEHLIRYGVDGI